MSKIILQQPNYLFNFSNIGYQTYFVEQSALDLMQKLNFDIHRLGQARSKMDDVEPIIRNADLVSFDIGAIRHSEAPGNANASPNGFLEMKLASFHGTQEFLISVLPLEFTS